MSRILLVMLFLPCWMYAQLADFTLSVSVTDETCGGNGALQFTVDGTTPGSDINYFIYLLPNSTVPVQTTDQPSYQGLSAGEYMVTAVQTLGAESNSASVNVTIGLGTPPIPVIDVVLQAQDCNNANQITIEVISGTVTQYEIFEGPVKASPQTSNVFTGLVDGEYKIRVYDECGQGSVTSFTLDFNPQSPVVSTPIISDPLSGDCNSVTLTYSVSYPEGTIISYPLTVEYTVHPPDGSADFNFTKTFTSGDLVSVELSNTFPYVAGGEYTYDVTITNGCGTTFNDNGNSFNPAPIAGLGKLRTDCGFYYLSLNVSQFNPPFTVKFIKAPEGFNPASFQSAYPGPFSTSPVIFGSDEKPVLEGDYEVTITDACGRVSNIAKITIINDDPVPTVGETNNGCFSDFGRITISIPNRKLVSAVITEAPPAYTETLPQDVSANINPNGVLVLTDMPVGSYKFKLVDSCGADYIDVEAEIPLFSPQGFTATPAPDCEQGYGAVTVVSGNGKLVSASITTAPPEFEQQLPYDVSQFIEASSGSLFLNALPEGQYVFSGTDACGITETVAVTITGYVPTANVFNFLPQCNSFNIDLADTDTLAVKPTYWLQMEDGNNPGTWVHPVTGVAYTEGEVPNSQNAVQLVNNTLNTNFQYFGTFRILKAFESVGNGGALKVCISQLDDAFEYQYGVTIDNIYSVNCDTYPSAVYVEASGLAPLQYTIVDTNDTSIELYDNGTSNIFVNLPSGGYTFKVEDACGATRLLFRDVSTLPDLVDAATPPDLPLCIATGDDTSQPVDLTQQNSLILNGAAPESYIITYYTTEAAASAGSGAIDNPQEFYIATNPQTIYARVQHAFINVCSDIVSFRVQVGNAPVVVVDEEQFLCEEVGNLTLDAGGGFDSYSWMPGGETTRAIQVTQPGDYTVTVASGLCTDSATITVLPVAPPEIIDIEVTDWTENDNTITVVVNDPGRYQYSLDGLVYQQSNTFTGLGTGIFTVYVQDRQGCAAVMQEVSLLYYPKFFSPNGDGNNETWRVAYSWTERQIMTYVYDRYGKLIKGFDSSDAGWDGTLNGSPLPSTDYWFVVVRADGRVHKGHFSLIR